MAKKTSLTENLENNGNNETVDETQFHIKKNNNYTPLISIFSLLSSPSGKKIFTSQQIDKLMRHSNLNCITSDGANALMLYITLNKTNLLDLSYPQKEYLIKNSNLKIRNKNGMNCLMLAFLHNKKENLHFTQEQWSYLIKNSDLMQTNNSGENALMYFLDQKHEQNINLFEKDVKYLIENSDLKQQNQKKYNALMKIFETNYFEKFNLSEDLMDYIIHNTDINQQDKNGWNSLIYALSCNKNQKLNLNQKQWNYLITKSDLNQTDTDGWNALLYTFLNEVNQNINLDKNIRQFLLNNSPNHFYTFTGTSFFSHMRTFDEYYQTNISNSDYKFILNGMMLNKPENLHKFLVSLLDENTVIYFQHFWSLFDDKKYLLDFLKQNNTENKFQKFLDNPYVSIYEEKDLLNTKTECFNKEINKKNLKI